MRKIIQIFYLNYSGANLLTSFGKLDHFINVNQIIHI